MRVFKILNLLIILFKRDPVRLLIISIFAFLSSAPTLTQEQNTMHRGFEVPTRGPFLDGGTACPDSGCGSESAADPFAGDELRQNAADDALNGGSGGQSPGGGGQATTPPPLPESCPRVAGSGDVSFQGQSMRDVARSCGSTSDQSHSTCDTNKDSTINQFMGPVKQITQAMTQAAINNPEFACTKAAQLSAAANAALSGFQTVCGGRINTCEQTCTDSSQQIRQALNEAQRCNYAASGVQSPVSTLSRLEQDIGSRQNRCSTGDRQQLQTAAQDAMTYLGAREVAKNCQQDLFLESDEDVCLTNPSLPQCGAQVASATFCRDNPSTQVCICERNPRDPSCPGAPQPDSYTGPGLSSYAAPDVSHTNSMAEDYLAGGEGAFASDNGLERVQHHGRGGLVENKQGRGAGGLPAVGAMGQGGFNGQGSMGDSKSFSNLRAALDSMFGGSSGGGGGARAQGASINSRDSNTQRGPASATNEDENKRLQELNGILAKAAYGGGNLGPDGITPNTYLTIWEKVSNQYRMQLKKGNLDPNL